MTGWHLNKRVPLAFIVVIMTQTAAGLWWAATAGSRVTVLEEWKAENGRLGAGFSPIE